MATKEVKSDKRLWLAAYEVLKSPDVYLAQPGAWPAGSGSFHGLELSQVVWCLGFRKCMAKCRVHPCLLDSTYLPQRGREHHCRTRNLHELTFLSPNAGLKSGNENTFNSALDVRLLDRPPNPKS